MVGQDKKCCIYSVNDDEKKSVAVLLCFLCRRSVGAVFVETGCEGTECGQNPGTRVVREYRFTNAGDVPLVIVDSKVSCTCTKVDFPKKPVMPGQSGVVTVKYDPRKQPAGKIYKAIQLFSNDPDGRHVLVFRGEVVR